MHPALAAHRTAREVDAGEPMQQPGGRFRLRVLRWWRAEEDSAPRQRHAPRAIREQAEVANAHEAARHDVEQKASQEIIDVERHDLHAVVVGVVLPTKLNAAVAVIDEAIIGQRDTVHIPPEVGEDRLGAGEGPFRIHDPVNGPRVSEEAGEATAIGQVGGAAREGQLAGVERPLQTGEIFSHERRPTAPGQERGTTSDSRSSASGRRPRRRR